MVDVRVEDGDMGRAGLEILGMADEKIIEHRSGRQEGAEDEHEGVFPEAFQEFFVGEYEGREEDDEDERGNPEGDVGVEAKAEDETGKKEITQPMCSQSSEEEIKGKGQDKGDHDGPEADTGKVDGPVGSGEHEGRKEAGSSAMEELSGEQGNTEDREGTEENGGEFQAGDGVADEPDEQGLDIDEETFAAIIGRVEEFESAGFQGVDSVDTVGSLIGVEADRNAFNVIETDEEGESNDHEQYPAGQSELFFVFCHKNPLAPHDWVPELFFDFRLLW